jgi:hypothetical protein
MSFEDERPRLKVGLFANQKDYFEKSKFIFSDVVIKRKKNYFNLKKKRNLLKNSELI